MAIDPTSPVVERGRNRLYNWRLWSRLDGSDTGYPRRTSYYTPPRTGDTFDDGESAPEDIDHRDAALVDEIIHKMPYTPRICIKYVWIERRKKSDLARALGCSFQTALDHLTEAEAEIGRAR
jgi:hypothetical protein